jgi:hypothetical protein
MASIRVYYKDIGGGIYHKYIVYTDNNGNKWAARGGPEHGFSHGFPPRYRTEIVIDLVRSWDALYW